MRLGLLLAAGATFHLAAASRAASEISCPPGCPATFFVDRPNDAPDGDLSDCRCGTSGPFSTCTLRAAVQQANELPLACAAPDICLGPETYTLTGGHLDVTHGLTISGAGATSGSCARLRSSSTGAADKTVIDGNAIGRVLQIGETSLQQCNLCPGLKARGGLL